MRVHHHRRAEELADALIAAWAGPRADPFGFDLAVVPGVGFQRWLSQRIASARPDGICAGVEFCSPAALERRLRDPDDPWLAERLVWPILRIAGAGDDPHLEVLSRHLDASREPYTACRRIAGHLAGYARYRPAMVQAWADGADEGPNRLPLGENAWQARLWRRLVDELGTDPLQQRDEQLALLRAAPVAGVPERVAVIAPRLDQHLLATLTALGEQHQVDLLMLQPSPSRRPAPVSGELRDADFTAPEGHPLNLALGRLADHGAALLGVAAADGGSPEVGSTLLGSLQAQLLADSSTPALAPADDSVQVHLSHDLGRQVEVLREVLTRLLAEHPHWEPRDIVVLTPDVDAVAPLVTAAFATGAGQHPASRFRVQLADRSVAQVNSAVTVLLSLLELSDGRVEASTLLDLCQQPLIADRFGFGADAHDRLTQLVTSSGIRWGLSAGQRADFGLGSFPQNTWFAGLQRMLLGVALPESDLISAGTVLPLDDVESSDVALIGALTEFVGRLSRIITEFATPAPLAEWSRRCRTAMESVAGAPRGQDWELSQLSAGLSRLAGLDAPDEPALVSRVAAQRVIEEAFSRAPARAGFGNGSLLVAGLQSLRHVPHPAVVLLGWDAERYPRPARLHGDNLLGDQPRLGDPAPTLLDRQLLLDAVHAAREQLIVIAQSRDVASNEPVPLASPVAELIDAVGPAVIVEHPLQPFNPGYFDGRSRLYSADPLAFQAAQAMAAEPVPERPRFALDPLEPPSLAAGLTLDQLVDFFNHPAKALLKVRAGVTLGEPSDDGDGIPIELDHLQRWQIGNRVLTRLRAGHDPDAVRRAEWLRGQVPPFELGQVVIGGVLREAGKSLRAIPPASGEPQLHDLDLHLAVPGLGTVPLVGRVRTAGAELLQVEFSSLSPRHRLGSWIRLLALAASGQGVERARVIGKGRVAVVAAPPAAVAERLLGDLLAIYRLGLSRPLPALPKVGLEWAELRASQRDPLDPKAGRPRLKARWDWEVDRAWTTFFDFDGALELAADVVEIPGADPGERRLVGALASAIWSPLLASEVPA